MVKSLTIEILKSNDKPKIIEETPNNKAMIREPNKNPWPTATLRPTVAPTKSVNGRTYKIAKYQTGLIDSVFEKNDAELQLRLSNWSKSWN